MKKKHLWDTYFLVPSYSKKLLLTMKLILIITFTLCVSINATTYSQSTRMSLDIKNQSIREVLKSIEDQTNFRFFYNDEFTDLNKTITLKFTDKTIEEILSEVFNESEVTYKLLDNNFVVITPVALAQTIKVTGKVIDANTGEPLPGVNIIVDGSTQGVISDINGNYSIEIDNKDAVLVYSFVGYTTQKVALSGRTQIDVQLAPDVKALDEVVVIGYGVQRKGDVTSAVVSVKAKDFLPGKMQDAAELIKGKVAGLTVAKSSGDPNASSTITLRGIGTLQGNQAPLILVDGIPGDLTTVAPENIESFSVLKDASAAAIYGSRGANGVILITTKTGSRSEKMTVNYSGYASVSDFLKKADFMTPTDIRHGLTSFNDDGWDTDWLKAVTRKGFTNNHSLSISGGTNTMTYTGNISYRNELGTIKNSDNEEYKMQLDVTQYFFKDILKINMNLLKGIHSNTANNASDGGITNIYRQAVIHNPTSPIYNETTGEYYEEFGRFQYYNPVAMVNELIGDYRSEWTHMTGNVTLEPIKKWQTNLMVSTQRFNANTSTYTTGKYYLATTTGYAGSAYKGFGSSQNDYLELTTRYSFSLGNNHFTALGGYSFAQFENDGFSASNADFPNDSYQYNYLGSGSLLQEGKASMNSDKADSRLIGFFGRFTSNFNDKYNLLLSVRREGSSKFGANNKYGTFPSASVGWTISNEGFMKQVTIINNLKLRVGYGITGVIPGDSYRSLIRYNFKAGTWGNYLNADGKWLPSLFVDQNPNPDLKWETTAEVNIGLDFSILNNRISGAFDFYNRKTTDLLYDYNVPVPPNLYNQTKANVGSLQNRGFELMLSASAIEKKDVNWNTTVTLSHNSSELLSLSNDLYETTNYLDVGWVGDPISVPTHRLEIGKGFGNYWGLKSVGVTADGLWQIENPKTGAIETYSTSLNTNDYRQYLGNGIPKIYMGWNNTFRYKQFDLSVQMSGQFGFKILNEQRMYYENNSIQYNRLRSAADLVYGTARLSGAQAQAFVSYYLENGDFVKFDNVTLGYTLTIPSIKKYISECRFYIAGQNLLCITGYKGLDPELANSDFMASGNDFRDKYPTIRSFTFGLNLKF
jgi:TonB-linked SusC/RagA family outer membrane protein